MSSIIIQHHSADFCDDAKSKFSDFNTELKTFDSAVKTLNGGNTLSYDEMVEIVELTPELQDFFDEMNGRYTIAADKITEWRKKSFEARNEYIQGLIDQVKAELQTAQDAKQAAEIDLNIQNKFGSVTLSFPKIQPWHIRRRKQRQLHIALRFGKETADSRFNGL